MELTDRVVVVTGGASGIGAALAQRFAEESARAVVVVDRNEDGAQAVAASLQGTEAISATLDVTDADATSALVDRLIAQFGGIDLYCANAGIATGAGLDASAQMWQQSWDINVMGHVHAASALVPHWLERGEGYLVTTASAAGLLTMVGDAPYSATKHAAVALAEWLSITYGAQGIRVSCLCPQGVRTPMLFGPATDENSAPSSGPLGGSIAAEAVLSQGVIEPFEAADAVVEAIRAERFLVLPHPEVANYEQARATDRERWLGGMRRLASRLSGK